MGRTRLAFSSDSENCKLATSHADPDGQLQIFVFNDASFDGSVGSSLFRSSALLRSGASRSTLPGWTCPRLPPPLVRPASVTPLRRSASGSRRYRSSSATGGSIGCGCLAGAPSLGSSSLLFWAVISALRLGLIRRRRAAVGPLLLFAALGIQGSLGDPATVAAARGRAVRSVPLAARSLSALAAAV